MGCCNHYQSRNHELAADLALDTVRSGSREYPMEGDASEIFRLPNITLDIFLGITG